MVDRAAIEALRAEVAALESEVDRDYQEAVRRDQELASLQDRVAAEDYGDSEYKVLSTRGPYVRAYYRWFARLWSIHALLSEATAERRPVRAPPRTLSEAQRRAFAMGGDVPVADAYFASPASIDSGIEFDAGALEIARQGPTADGPDPLFAAIAAHVRPGTTAGVCGSVVPCYEAACLNAGATTTAVGFGAIASRARDIAAISFADALATRRWFDCVIAGWRIGQAGMGRFDDVDPDGDLMLMQRLWRLVAPGGILIASLMTGPDLVVYNVTRVYGPRRLPLLLQGSAAVARYDDDRSDRPGAPILSALVLKRSTA